VFIDPMAYNLDHGKYRSEYGLPFSLEGIKTMDNFAERPEMTQMEVLLPSRLGPDEERRRRIFVLHGLGGIGKTQLAINFARRHHRRFSAIVWLNGSTERRLQQSFAEFADRIPYNQLIQRHTDHIDVGDNIAKPCGQRDHIDVLRWLALPNNIDWLLIFDGVDLDPTKGESGSYNIEKYLPGDHGATLVTTRLSRLAQLGRCSGGVIHLKKADAEVSRAIFNQWYGQELGTLTVAADDSCSPFRSLEFADRDHVDKSEAAVSLLKSLDGLPLALAQAATFLGETGETVDTYLNLYRENEVIFVDGDGALMDYERSVATTWTISYQAIEAQNKSAAWLLKTWAFFDNKDLFLPQGDTAWWVVGQVWLQDLFLSKVKYLEATRLLTRYSMVDTLDPAEGVYTVHGLVQKWTLFTMSRKEQRDLSRLAILVMGNAARNAIDYDYNALVHRLFWHAHHCTQLMFVQGGFLDFRWSQKDVHTLEAMDHICRLFEAMGYAGVAEAYLEWVIIEKKRVFTGSLEADTISDSELYRGILQVKLGQPLDAVETFQRVITREEKKEAPREWFVLMLRTWMGRAFRELGELDAAERAFVLVADRNNTIHGPGNLLSADAYFEIGQVKEDHSQLDEALSYYQRVLWIRDDNCGPDDPSALNAAVKVGYLADRLGKTKYAAELLQRVRDGWKKTTGLDDEETWEAYELYATTVAKDSPDAIEILLEILEIKESRLTYHNQSTIDTEASLAKVYRHQGLIDEAQRHEERVQLLNRRIPAMSEHLKQFRLAQSTEWKDQLSRE
jgi:tetratricopeptide (TPR) repeat protein